MSNSGRRGSVRQAENGTWYFVVDVGRNGERKQTRRRGFPTRRTAQTELNRILTSLEEQTYVAPKRQTLAQFLTDTWLPAIEHTVKWSTYDSYVRVMRLHAVERPIGNRQLQDITGSDLNALYAQLLAGDDKRPALSVKTVRYVSTILHRAFRDAMRWQAISRNPVDASDPPRPAERVEMQVWSPTHTREFLAGASEHRLSALWWLLTTTGMRRGEALGLKWGDMDLETGRAEIRRTVIDINTQPSWAWDTPKTKKSRRTVALDAPTVAALKAHRARQNQERMALGAGWVDHDLVVCRPDGSPCIPRRVSDQFLRLSARLGLPRIRLHDLRHTHATMALMAGIHPRVVQERLGHSNVSVTSDIYSHVDITLQADAADRVSRLLEGGDQA